MTSASSISVPSVSVCFQGCGASRAKLVVVVCQTCFTKVGSQKDKFVRLCFEPSERLCDEC